MSHYDHDRENYEKQYRARMLREQVRNEINKETEKLVWVNPNLDGPVNSNDPVNHPGHYNNHPRGIECKDVIEHFSYHLGRAIKYVWRCDEKGKPIEDLKKAIKSIQFEIDMRERK